MKTDIITLLEEQAAATIAPSAVLPLLSVWKEVVHKIVFFTLIPEIFRSHYDAKSKLRYQCLGDGECPACNADLKATEHAYLPVWDVPNRQVAVLTFHTGSDGPAKQLLHFLKTYKDRLAEVVAVINCKGGGALDISAFEMLPDTDRGVLACQAFCDGVEKGAISARGSVRRLTRAEIEALPEVKRNGAVMVGPPAAPSQTINPSVPSTPDDAAQSEEA